MAKPNDNNKSIEQFFEYNDDKDDSDDGKKDDIEPCLWTFTGELKIKCIDGCNEILKYCKYNELSNNINRKNDLSEAMECYNFKQCSNILTKNMLCFYCPIDFLRTSKGFDKIWCCTCILKKTMNLYYRRGLKQNIPFESIKFHNGVKIYGFGTVADLKTFKINII